MSSIDRNILHDLEEAGFIIWLDVDSKIQIKHEFGRAIPEGIYNLINSFRYRDAIRKELLDRMSGVIPTQSSLFGNIIDPLAGAARRDEGMRRALLGREDLVGIARYGAATKALLKPGLWASANDYHDYFQEHGIDSNLIQDAAGSVFMPLRKMWVNSGESERAKRAISNSTSLAIWLYVGPPDLGPAPHIPEKYLQRAFILRRDGLA